MSCSIHRYKLSGIPVKPSDSQAAKEMEARLKEMMAVRLAQDGGDFKARYDPSVPSVSGVSGFPTSNPKNS